MDELIDAGKAHLRVARPTDNLQSLLKFYRDGLGFKIITQFAGHDGFAGIILGHRGAGYHLEFTQKNGHQAGRAPTQDNLLVFYIPNEISYKAAVVKMGKAGFNPVPSFNPFWDPHGLTFEDPDGYRIVLFNGTWWAAE